MNAHRSLLTDAQKLLLTILCVAAGGCATPQPVLDLADKTSANVAIVSARLRQVSAESDRLYASRADNVSRLHGIIATQRAHLTYDQALTRKSGQGGDLELMTEMQAWTKQVDDIFAAAAQAEKERRDALTQGQTRIDTKTQILQQVAETLSALAARETVAERAQVLQKFASEVRDDIDKKLKEGTGSAADAKKLLDKLREDFSPTVKSNQGK